MNEKLYTIANDEPLTWNDDTVFCGESGHYCRYELFESETYHCKSSLEKKMTCDGGDSKTTEKLKHVIKFKLTYLVDPARYAKCNDNNDYCSGKSGWILNSNTDLLGKYDEISSDYRNTIFLKFFDNNKKVQVDAGNRFILSIDPLAIESHAQKIAQEFQGTPCGQKITNGPQDNKGDEKDKFCKGDEICSADCNCKGECLPDEPFADKHGCITVNCNNNGNIDPGEDCRYCADASCSEKDSICVPYDGKWTCLKNARTYATIKDLDKGSVFVRRWVQRDVEVPLEVGDRIMDGDEIILHRWPSANLNTYVQINWDDGKIGAASFSHGSGERFGSFFVGKYRNESVVVKEDYNRDNQIIGIENTVVFPNENPPLIQMYGGDAIDISLQVLTNLPVIPSPVSVGSTILLSPTKPTGSMTYINVNSNIILETSNDKTWTLYTLEGAPEIVHVNDGKKVDTLTVKQGQKASVSLNNKGSNLEEFNPDEVNEIIRDKKSNSSFIILGGVIILAIIIFAVLSKDKNKKKKKPKVLKPKN